MLDCMKDLPELRETELRKEKHLKWKEMKRATEARHPKAVRHGQCTVRIPQSGGRSFGSEDENFPRRRRRRHFDQEQRGDIAVRHINRF